MDNVDKNWLLEWLASCMIDTEWHQMTQSDLVQIKKD